jgi:lysophospholipase L1-like esterase
MKKLQLYFTALLFILPGLCIAQEKPDRFESTIREFEQQDKANGYKPEAVLFTGSSSIRMWKTLSDDMAPMPVLNRGFGGSTIPEVLYYANRIILPHKPRVIVFYCGENDLSNDEAKTSLALKSFKKFHQYMKDNLPETQLYFIAIKPSISREKYWSKIQKANKKIEKFISKKKNYFFVDTAFKMLDENGKVLQDIFLEDNLHMNAKGYTIWTETIKPMLETYYAD